MFLRQWWVGRYLAMGLGRRIGWRCLRNGWATGWRRQMYAIAELEA